MTSADLDLVIERTHHEHFRSLTADDQPDRAKRDGYRRVVREMAARIRAGDWTPAAEPPPAAPPPVPLSESLRLAKLVRACPHRRTATTCGCVTCGRDGLLKAYHDCLGCVAAREPTS